MTDLISKIKLANGLNLIQQVRWRMMRQKEPTAKVLDEMLKELAKIVGVLCNSSLSLW